MALVDKIENEGTKQEVKNEFEKIMKEAGIVLVCFSIIFWHFFSVFLLSSCFDKNTVINSS